ncbi:hypothetical protein Aros01_05064 [Streptosporangium roseum]|uniref:hypothetical protein n=1 Tax=Streptosporangium roseum TaxID=2001 RepID=UPI0001A3EF1A
MASEQSSQSHLPPAWPEAAEPPPAWAKDSHGTSPRLPLPPEEPAGDGTSWQAGVPGNGSWQHAFGAATPGSPSQAPQPSGPQSGGDSWQAAAPPQEQPGTWPPASPAENGGWPATQATDNGGWGTAPAAGGGGWDVAKSTDNGGWGTAAQNTGDGGWSTAPASNDGGRNAAAPAGNGGWDRPPAEAPSHEHSSPSWTNPPGGNPNPFGSQDPLTSPNPFGGQEHLTNPPGGNPNPFATQDPLTSPNPFGGQDPLTSPNPFGGQEHLTNPPGGNPNPFGSQDPLTSPNPFGGQEHLTNPPGGNPNPFGSQDPLTSPNPFGGQDPFGNPSGNGVAPENPGVWALAGATAPEAPPGAPPQLPPYHAPPQGGPAPAHPGNGQHPGQPHPGQPHPGQQPMAGQPGPGQPHPGQQPMTGQPGGHLSRDPSDPNRPFVTAGQISGPKTPPPERQQELWNTVFGDNYQAMDDEQELDGPGRPVWVFALAGSVVIALIGAVLWAFLAGPLASTKEEATPEVKPSATGKKPAKSQAVGRLPRFPGKASPVVGTLPDQAAAISVAKLGTPWQQDQRPAMPTTYGFTTRQYVPAGPDSTGKTQFAQVMSGPLSPRLKSKYTSPGNLAPVINAVASSGRKKFFPEDNSARKTAQQTLNVNGLRGQLSAYEITSGTSKTTMVVAALSTGADLPAIVYMSVPDSKKELLPDINTVFKSIRSTTP